MTETNLSNEWKSLMDLGLFDDSYPQRLRASFLFLCADNEYTDYFKMTDIVRKGYYVFSYLSIVVEKDSTFALMDLCRQFDRSGSGSIFVEDFVIGVIQRLHNMKENTHLFEEIARDLLSVESRSLELANLLEKATVVPNSANQAIANIPNYRNNLKSFSSYICAAIRETPCISALETPLLVQIFQLSISQAIAEASAYFHIKTDCLNSLSTSYTTLAPFSDGNKTDFTSLIWSVPKLECENYSWINPFADSFLSVVSETGNESLLRVTTSNNTSHDWRPRRVRTLY